MKSLPSFKRSWNIYHPYINPLITVTSVITELTIKRRKLLENTVRSSASPCLRLRQVEVIRQQ